MNEEDKMRSEKSRHNPVEQYVEDTKEYGKEHQKEENLKKEKQRPVLSEDNPTSINQLTLLKNLTELAMDTLQKNLGVYQELLDNLHHTKTSEDLVFYKTLVEDLTVLSQNIPNKISGSLTQLSSKIAEKQELINLVKHYMTPASS